MGNKNSAHRSGTVKDVEPLTQVYSLLSKFVGETKLSDESTMDIITGLMILSNFHFAQLPRLDALTAQERQIVRDADRYMKFASAAYGWRFIYPFLHKGEDKKTLTGLAYAWAHNKANEQALALHTGIDITKDLIEASWDTKEVFFPAYFVAVDHESSSIIFSIRGTMSLMDAQTDLIAESHEFEKGQAHSGMARAANKFYEIVKEPLVQLSKKYPTYRVVVVGHSLGAGTASLLTLLLRVNVPELNVHCFAFAPPPVVSRELSSQCEDFVYSFVLEDDIVPRLSYGAMCDLLEHVKLQRQNMPGSVFSVFRNVMMQNLPDPTSILRGGLSNRRKSSDLPISNVKNTNNSNSDEINASSAPQTPNVSRESETKNEEENKHQNSTSIPPTSISPQGSPSLEHIISTGSAPNPTEMQSGPITKDNESPSISPAWIKSLFINQPIEVVPLHSEKKHVGKLFLTGKVFHVFDKKQRMHLQKKFNIPSDSLRSAEQAGGGSLGQLSSENLDVGRATNLEDFHEIALSRRMFAVHMPTEYDVAFDELVGAKKPKITLWRRYRFKFVAGIAVCGFLALMWTRKSRNK